MLKRTLLCVTCAMLLGLTLSAGGAVITVTTDFESATSVRTDGRDSGFADQGTAEFDTTDGWTWYTEASTTNDNLTIPFGSGTKTIGEQEVRVAGGLELETNDFFFGWGPSNHANALRSQTFTDVGAGTANVNWVAVQDGKQNNIKVYYSQDSGTNWTAVTKGADFTASAGALEVVIVGNDGVDSNTKVDTVTISYTQIPEPATMGFLAFGGLLGLRRRRR